MNILQTLYEQVLFESLWDSDAVDTESSPFLGNVYRLYELEYKLQALKNSQLGQMNPKRLENITNQVKIELSSSATILKKILLGTFANWLKKHALLKPNVWATNRYDEANSDMGFGDNEIFDSIVGEYSQYVYNNEIDRYGRRRNFTTDHFFPVIDRNLSKMPYTLSILEPVYKEYMQEQYDNDLENTMKEWQVSTPEEADAYMEKSNLIDQGLESFIYESEILIDIIDRYGDLRTFFIELYEKIVFPVWFAHWEAEGIVETRKRVQNVYNNLKKASPKDLGNMVAWLSAALNTAHQSGSMLDHVPDTDDDFYVEIDGEKDTYYEKDFLTALTDGKYNNQWDKELGEAGV